MWLFSLNKIYNEYIVFFSTVSPNGSLINRTPKEFYKDGLIKAKENRQN